VSDHRTPHDSEEEAAAQADQSCTEHAPLQVDVFGVKLKAPSQPRPADEPDPESWDVVWPRINKHLMAFVVNFFGFLPDSVKAARSFVRGLGKLPDSIAERIGRAHEIADEQEESRQTETRGAQLLSIKEAKYNFEAVIAGLQAKGIAVTMHQEPSGEWVITTTRPELEDKALEVVEHLMLEDVRPQRAESSMVTSHRGDEPSGAAELEEGKWYISEGFKAINRPATNEEQEEMLRHNRGAHQMRIAGPFDTKDDAEADLSTLTGVHSPFIWQYKSP